MRFLKLPVTILIIIAYCSCSKSGTSLTPDFYILYGDTTYFSNNLLLFSSADSLTENIIISSTYLTSKNVTVTVAVNPTAIADYNDSTGASYQLMPANAYSFAPTVSHLTTKVLDTIPITFYRNAIDASQNLMLPITITNADGYSISSTTSATIYFHTIGSKLSGQDTATGTIVNYIGDASANNVESIDTFSLAKNIVPLTLDSSALDYANLGANGWQYQLYLSSTGAFTVTPNTIILNSVDAGSFQILNSSYNSSSHVIYIKSTYKNTSGNQRIVQETLTLK